MAVKRELQNLGQKPQRVLVVGHWILQRVRFPFGARRWHPLPLLQCPFKKILVEAMGGKMMIMEVGDGRTLTEVIGEALKNQSNLNKLTTTIGWEVSTLESNLILFLR